MPFQIVRNDITKVKATIIVNTANPRPSIGGGTDSAIYKAAGEKELLSREQARVMLEALEDICGRAAFRIDRMEAAERSFLYEYTKDSEAGRIIRSALSPKLTL